MATTYTRELSDADIVAIQHLATDAVEWIDTAISEKIANGRKAIIRQHIDEAIKNDTPIPPTADEIVAAEISSPDYMNRAQRDEAGETPVEPAPVDPAPVAELPPTETKSDGQPA